MWRLLINQMKNIKIFLRLPKRLSVFCRILFGPDEDLVRYLQNVDTLNPIPEAFFNPLYEKLKMYYVTGGMPESVLMWTKERDVKEFPKISMIWRSIPSQLARENKKFIYKVVKEGARAREYKDALQWLVDANLVSKIYRSTAPGLPVSAYDDLSAFKIYLVDVGLLRRLAQLAPTAFGEGNRLFVEFKGALSENYVLETLRNQFNTEAKSLKKYKEKYGDKVKLRVRFSLDILDIFCLTIR